MLLSVLLLSSGPAQVQLRSSSKLKTWAWSLTINLMWHPPSINHFFLGSKWLWTTTVCTYVQLILAHRMTQGGLQKGPWKEKSLKFMKFGPKMVKNGGTPLFSPKNKCVLNDSNIIFFSFFLNTSLNEAFKKKKKISGDFWILKIFTSVWHFKVAKNTFFQKLP